MTAMVRGKELGPTIRVNAICPGVIATEVAVFLATSEPSFITGQAFVVDGLPWVM